MPGPVGITATVMLPVVEKCNHDSLKVTVVYREARDYCRLKMFYHKTTGNWYSTSTLN